jgi:23S rRNA pseudouridine1911/1915/1917 synthase
VINKPAGIASEATRGEQSASLFSVPALLCSTWNNPNAYVGVVHRLDVGVSGVMVYAKTPAAAANLSRQITASQEAYARLDGRADGQDVQNNESIQHIEMENIGSKMVKKYSSTRLRQQKNFADSCAPCFVKEYRAVVAGAADTTLPEAGLLRDYLFKDSRKGRAFAVDHPRKGVREAVLEYQIQASATVENQTFSLVSIILHTGRTHQIRVQFASRKHPLWGDGKYGSRQKGAIALQCARLQFLHPETGEKMDFSAPMPENLPFSLF